GGRVGHARGGAVVGAQGEDLAGHLLADGDALPRQVRRDARQVRGQSRVEDGLPGRVEGGQGVVRRLGGGRRERGAVRGVDVGEVGLVRSVDGVHGVEHGDVNDRQVTGQGDAGRLGRQGLQEDLVPVQDDVARQQAAILQSLDAEPPLLQECHDEISFGLRYDGDDNASGAQTERRGGAGPAGGKACGGGPGGRFYVATTFRSVAITFRV